MPLAPEDCLPRTRCTAFTSSYLVGDMVNGRLTRPGCQGVALAVLPVLRHSWVCVACEPFLVDLTAAILPSIIPAMAPPNLLRGHLHRIGNRGASTFQIFDSIGPTRSFLKCSHERETVRRDNDGRGCCRIPAVFAGFAQVMRAHVEAGPAPCFEILAYCYIRARQGAEVQAPTPQS